MIEPRPDMLPEQSQTEPVVSQDAKTEEVTLPAVLPSEAPKVVKTPENELYAALKEERQRRKEVEERLKEIESQLSVSPDENDMSDEGRFLRKEISSLKDELSSIRESQEMEKLFAQHPVLKDKQEEFNEFRTEYPRTKLSNIAKLFLVENNLLEEMPQRIGLEKTTGGNKLPISSGHTIDDIKRLREEQPRKYAQMLREGKIKPDDIK